jgi:hypothetical protein
MEKEMRNLLTGGWRHATVGALACLLISLMASGNPGPKFYDDDPLAVEPETQDASRVQPWKIDLFYDLLLNQFGRPGEPAGPRAKNINTIDEVPDSSWFTNRILARPVSIEEAVRGPLTTKGPAPGTWSVTHAKTEGDAPGFRIRDSAGEAWFLAFDPKSNPEGATAAAVIAMRIFYTLGYFQAEYHISEFRREQLEVDPKAEFDPVSRRVRPMKLKDMEPMLARSARKPDGAYRVLASRLLPGKILGGFKYFGTRPDDPNDIVPHEHRRELRALKVFAAWTNLVDLKALNTMDTLITENGKARVRHYLLDIGSTFGMGANAPREWTEGYENLYEGDKAFKRLVSFGFYLQPWQTAKYNEHPAIGRFEGEEFDPEKWKSRVPMAAMLRARDDDNFWAARRVMAFSDEMIRALVKAGQYSDPEAEKLLSDVLIQRRNKIGQVYLTRINPLVNFSLGSSGALTFENAAVKAGVAQPAGAAAASWFNFDNNTGATTPLGETQGSGDRINAPSGLPKTPGGYILAEVRITGSPHESWSKPVRAFFRRTNDGWKLVGLERMGEQEPATEAKKPTSN